MQRVSRQRVLKMRFPLQSKFWKAFLVNDFENYMHTSVVYWSTGMLVESMIIGAYVIVGITSGDMLFVSVSMASVCSRLVV